MSIKMQYQSAGSQGQHLTASGQSKCTAAVEQEKQQIAGEQVKCPVCGHRFFDKEDKASGFILHKCSICKNIWRIDLAALSFMNIKRSRNA